ncbi:MAG: hypothetical protein P1U35_02905 [Cycloclasticus sp.]|nr:hypothetical protein [Cycloclasticus sp.]
MSNVIKLRPTVPDYAVNLLFAAKGALCATPHDLDKATERLEDAVLTFEDEMPVDDGVIRTDG